RPHVSALLPALASPPRSPLFPYTTLFRSCCSHRPCHRQRLEEHRNVLAVVYCSSYRPGHRHRAMKCGSHSIECEPHFLRCGRPRSEEHTSELQSRENLVCRLLLEKKKQST